MIGETLYRNLQFSIIIKNNKIEKFLTFYFLYTFRFSMAKVFTTNIDAIWYFQNRLKNTHSNK